MNTLPFPILKNAQRTFPIQIVWQDVIRLNGDRNYTVVVLANGKKHTSTKTLGMYKPHLPQSLIRVHKQCIINQNFIADYNVSTHCIILTDGTTVKIARRRWKDVKVMLKAILKPQ